MKRILLTAALLMCLAFYGAGQSIGFNDNNSDPNTSAIVDVYSATKGMLIPRVSLDSTLLATPVTSPATSLLVYNTATIHDVIPGYYYWNGSLWNRLETSKDNEINYLQVTKTSDATLLKSETMVLASGDILLTLPAITSADDGLEIVVKNIGSYMDYIVVKPESGKKIDASDSTMLTRWNDRTFIAYGSNWLLKNNDCQADNLYDVGPSASFTTIEEVVEFLNDHMCGPTVVRIDNGTHSISSTQTIDLPYPVTFQGISFGESIIECPSGDTAFNAVSECYFKMLVLYGGETPGPGIVLSGADTYYEIKDGYFFGLSKGIIVSNSADFWLFEVDFDSCLTSAVEINAGDLNDVVYRSSECDYYNCAIGINLLSGGPNSEVSILNGTFYNYDTAQIGINYLPPTEANNFRYSSMIIQNNSFNIIGHFYVGFDFSRADARDANIFFENNAGIESSRPHCKVNVANSTASTTVTTSNTWYKANSFTSYTSSTTKWTIANNRITYQSNNVRTGIGFISGNIRCNNSSRIINIALVKNGQSGTRYGETTVRIPANSANQSFQFSTNVLMENLQAGDYFEIWITSNYGLDQLVIDDLNWYTDTH